MSLPSINFLHLTVSEIQPGQTFSRRLITQQGIQTLEIGRIGMCNVHPKGSMSFALKLAQNWQE